MKKVISFSLFALIFSAAFAQQQEANPPLPAPDPSKLKNFSNVIGWEGQQPTAPDGFQVSLFASGFENPRWMYVLENGDVLVAETNGDHTFLMRLGAPLVGANKSNNLKPSANRITLIRDSNNDGLPDERHTFLEMLYHPFGMLVLGDWFYVANTDALWRFPYKTGQLRILGEGEKIADLPAGKHNRHWTRNIIANEDGSKIYVAVGSGSNIAENGMENEILRAAILEMNPDGTEQRVFASGLRNPVGMGWAPGTRTLWTVVNERDELGDDLVPDYLTSVKEDGFYGWPYVYYGQHKDDRVKEAMPDIAKETIVPDLQLGAHTASLGLVFYDKKNFPTKYQNGAFIAQHGSWNRSVLSGYKVVFVPFSDGKPSGPPEDFLTGFIADLDKGKVHGRPVGLAILPDGALLIADDKSNTIWKVAANQIITKRK